MNLSKTDYINQVVFESLTRLSEMIGKSLSEAWDEIPYEQRNPQTYKFLYFAIWMDYVLRN